MAEFVPVSVATDAAVIAAEEIILLRSAREAGEAAAAF